MVIVVVCVSACFDFLGWSFCWLLLRGRVDFGRVIVLALICRHFLDPRIYFRKLVNFFVANFFPLRTQTFFQMSFIRAMLMLLDKFVEFRREFIFTHSGLCQSEQNNGQKAQWDDCRLKSMAKCREKNNEIEAKSQKSRHIFPSQNRPQSPIFTHFIFTVLVVFSDYRQIKSSKFAKFPEFWSVFIRLDSLKSESRVTPMTKKKLG